MRRRFSLPPNNAIDEGRRAAGLGELPEDLLGEQGPNPPILTPRGNPTANPFQQMPAMVAPPPATRLFTPQTMTTYRVDVPAGAPLAIFAATRERCYSLVVNGGAGAAVITYGRNPADATDGIPLAAAGVGFHELPFGTVSTMAVFAAADTFLIITEGRYDPAMER